MSAAGRRGEGERGESTAAVVKEADEGAGLGVAGI